MGRKIPQEEEITKYVRIALATGLFIGYSPVAPGTLSCAISIVLWHFLLPFKVAYVIVGASLFGLGIAASDGLARDWGEDPRRVVVDEYASFMLPLYFTPARILPLVIAFLLFRFFDIVKPPPIRQMERLRGGWGIMFDDLVAAIFTTIIVLLLRIFVPGIYQ